MFVEKGKKRVFFCIIWLLLYIYRGKAQKKGKGCLYIGVLLTIHNIFPDFFSLFSSGMRKKSILRTKNRKG